jgi:hypothetical protein
MEKMGLARQADRPENGPLRWGSFEFDEEAQVFVGENGDNLDQGGGKACCPVPKEGAKEPIRFTVTDKSDTTAKGCQAKAYVKVEAWWKEVTDSATKLRCTCDCCEVRQYVATVESEWKMDEMTLPGTTALGLVPKSQWPQGTPKEMREVYPKGTPFHLAKGLFVPSAANEDVFSVWKDKQGLYWREDLALGMAATQVSNLDPDDMARAAGDSKYREDLAKRLREFSKTETGELTTFQEHKINGKIVPEGTKGLCEWEHDDDPEGPSCLPAGGEVKRLSWTHKMALMVVIRPVGDCKGTAHEKVCTISLNCSNARNIKGAFECTAKAIAGKDCT